MLGLAKGLMVTVLGIGGVGGVAYGIAKATSNPWDSKKKEIAPSEPVLVCGDGYSKWRVILKVAEGKENNLGEGITFKVIRVFDEKTRKEKEIPWGNRAKEEYDWPNWRLNFTGKEINGVWFKETISKDYHSTYLLSVCDSTQIELINPKKNQGEHGGIEATNIRFTVDKASCKDPYSEGCNIQFASGINLKWKQGFRPKVIFYK